MKPIYAPLILAILALPACAPLQALSAPVAAMAPDTMDVAKKTLTAAHDAHASTARLLTIAAQTQLCTKTCAATAKGYLDRSEAYLVAADKLVALGDAPGIEDKIGAATALLAQVQGLVGKK